MEAYKQFKKDLAVGLVLVMFIMAILELFEADYDSTDGESRSGMSLHIDNMTRCHYLGGKNGGLTPRMTSSGKHFCG